MYDNIAEVRADVVQYINTFKAIELYHFNYALIYLPFYLALNKVAGNKSITFKPYGNDLATQRNLLNPTTPASKHGNNLKLGLSEVSRDTTAHKIPFITRLPLWGIALSATSTNHNSFADNIYNKTFGSKISRIDIAGLSGLRIGTYEKGSTSYKLINSAFSEHGAGTITATESDEKRAYKKLIDKEIDVFFTIQPWLMTQYAKDSTNIQIMIVYNHPTPVDVYTTIYAKGLDDQQEDKLFKKFLELLGFLVWEEAADLYASKRDNFQTLITEYCNIRTKRKTDFDRCANTAGHACEYDRDVCEWCHAPKIPALEIICDSRIYYVNPDSNKSFKVMKTTLEEDVFAWEDRMFLEHGISELEDDNTNMEAIVQKYFPYRWANNIKKIRDKSDEQAVVLRNDPIYLISKLLLTQMSEHRHKGETKIGKDDKKELMGISALLRSVDAQKIFPDNLVWGISKTDHVPNVNDDWRIYPDEDNKGYAKVLPRLMCLDVPLKKIEGATFFCLAALEDNVYEPLLKKAFLFLDADLGEKANTYTTNKILGKRINGLPVQGIDNIAIGETKPTKEVLNILYIEYSCTDTVNEPGKFVKDNPVGHQLLNGYWIKNGDPVNCFKKAHDISLTTKNNNSGYALTIKWKNMEPVEIQMDNSNEAWLFTFRTLA